MGIKRAKPKMIDPPRYPSVTVPIDQAMKGKYGQMVKSMTGMLKVGLLKTLSNE